MRYRDHRVTNAADLALQAIELLDAVGECQAMPHLKQAVTILKEEAESSCDRGNRVAIRLLRMALVLLDRNGECAASIDVQTALDKLGALNPVLSEAESSALIDWRTARLHAKAGDRSAG